MDRIALSPREAAKQLGVAPSTFRLWMREEGLPYSRVRGRVLIRVDELLAWLDSRKEQPEGVEKERIRRVVAGVRVVG